MSSQALIKDIIKKIQQSSIKNIRIMEPILHHIPSDKHHNIQGLICPGHVAGAKPLYLSAGSIIEEGFSMQLLECCLEYAKHAKRNAHLA